MAFYTYILQSEMNQQFYIGQTQDIEKRLFRHNAGSVPSTKRYRPWKLVYYKEFNSRTDAIKFENKLKNLKSHKYIEEYLLNASRL